MLWLNIPSLNSDKFTYILGKKKKETHTVGFDYIFYFELDLIFSYFIKTVL